MHARLGTRKLISQLLSHVVCTCSVKLMASIFQFVLFWAVLAALLQVCALSLTDAEPFA